MSNTIFEPTKDKETAGENPSISSNSSDVGEKPAPAWKPSMQVWILFGVLCSITLAAALDATSLSVALPIIARALKGTAVEAFWAGTSFLLTSTVFQPLFASLSIVFGRKSLLLLSLIFFTVGSIVAAVAQNFTTILVGRSIQGIGGGGIIAITEIAITDLIPLRERGKYFGIFSMMWAIGSVTGPIMGGGFAEDVSWRWILWINLPFCAIGFVGVPLFMKLHHRQQSTWTKFTSVDWFGAVLFIASTTAILIPISWGGVMYSWSSFRTLVPLVLGSVGLIGFIFWEVMGTAEPMITPKVFMNRTAAANYFGTIMHGIILWALLYYLPLYFEAAKGMSPIMTGVAIFPQTFTVSPASIVVGILVSVTGRFRWAIWAGWILTTLGMGLMFLIDEHTPTWKWIVINLVGGLGTGMLFPSMGFAIQASATNEDTAIAVAMFSFLRAFGQTFGIAVGGVVFQNTLVSKLGEVEGLKDVAGMYVKDAVAMVQLIKTMEHGPIRDALVKAYADSLANVWLAMVGFAAAGGIVSLWTVGLDLNRELVTEQGLRDEKKPGEKGDA